METLVVIYEFILTNNGLGAKENYYQHQENQRSKLKG